jgi:hypothetical protein
MKPKPHLVLEMIIEAMQQAIDALKNTWGPDAKEVKAVDALREAIRYMEGQRCNSYPEGDVVGPCVCGSWPGGKCLKCPRVEQAEKPPKESGCAECGCKAEDGWALYCLKCVESQREWVGLTPEDYDSMRPRVPHTVNDFTFADVAAIVEAKLKEKNA